MAPDVVSPLSARVSATLAIAHTFLFTVLKALMPLSVRSVLETCYAKGLYFFSLAYSDFLRVVYTMSDLSSIVVALPTPLLAVVLVAMRSLLPCYLAGFNLLAFISYFLAAIDPFLPASPIQFCVVGSSAGIRCGTARHNFTITDLASQLIRYLISLIGPSCRCGTSDLSVIEPFLPAPPMQFCVLGSGAGIRCRPARHRPTVSDLSGQLVRYLIALVGSSYCSITSALSDIFSGTSGIVACAVLLFCCFAFVFFCSLWMLHSLKTPMDEEELGAGATPTQVDGSIDTDHSIPANTQPPKINTVDSYLGVSGDEAETPSSISESVNQAVSLSSAVLDIHPDLTGPRAAEPVHAGHAIPIREVEDEADDDASQFIVSVNPLRAPASPNGRPASESNNRGASQESSNQHKCINISEVSASRAIDRAPTHGHSTSTPPSSVEDLPTIEANTLCDRFPESYRIHPTFHAEYELGKLLGAGAHGFVIEARRRQDGREVAVKFVRAADDSRVGRPWHTHSVHGRVPYEVVVLHGVVHDNVIALVEVLRDDTYVYIVQELHGTLWNPVYEGGKQIYPNGSRSLLAYIRQNGPMPASDAKYVFKQLVEAIRFFHACGLSHCDIKPENMVIDTTLKLKVIDFGCSRRSTKSPRPWYTNPRIYGGTRKYNAPELHKGELFQPEKADVWAMGAVLYEMLTGERAFQDEDSIKKGLLNYYPEQTSNVHGVNLLWPLIAGCFQEDPSKRWSAERLSRHPLLQ